MALTVLALRLEVRDFWHGDIQSHRVGNVERISAARAFDCNGRAIFLADAHPDNGKRLIVRADEKLTAFAELESATRAGG